MINKEKEEFLNKCRKDPKFVQDTIDQFDRLFYYSSAIGGAWKDSYWLGIPIQKNPMDLMVYQELTFMLKPDIIIETGTKVGGSALFFATILDAIGKGEVITIDINHADKPPQHSRIAYLTGSSIEIDIINFLRPRIKDKTVMVILDSDHNKEHVLKELEIYSKFVSIGSYLIVEDTNITGYPLRGMFGQGPLEAIADFLKDNKEFKINSNCEKYYSTFSRCGFLIRVS